MVTEQFHKNWMKFKTGNDYMLVYSASLDLAVIEDVWRVRLIAELLYFKPS